MGEQYEESNNQKKHLLGLAHSSCGGMYVLNTVSAYGYVYAGPRKGHLLHLLGSSWNNKGNDNIGKEL